MDTVMITCRTLETEVRRAMNNTGRFLPVTYLESGLHARPKMLTDALTKLFKDVRAERVLLCIGQCGNALMGLTAGDFEMISPKVDDCLSLLIGSTRKKTTISFKDRAFFLTSGWLKGESTIMSEFKRLCDEYDSELALEIIGDMYANYRTIGLVDTGTAPMDELFEKTEELTGLLGFERKVYPGTTDYIEQLLTGPWNTDRFVIKKPFETITTEDYEGM